ncbi:MAG: hypothetical protein CBC84_000890 [Pelagibacteraceae bacterium TMED124]|nr:hypothetical protein [Candidatus Neomarinimicrobiota bacterium]RPG19112.1 MAG: hypothetical protein CBC84_000890 [Pelagibacteraceae bacterium TMED124]|tara:strand:- start:13794 stop:14231 length:438 start_codon:yes stop_codon:yes gene_type:complete
MYSFLLFGIIINSILIGVIIVTQLVSYPLFLKVPKQSFSNYHSLYTNRISIIVIPLMIVEVFITFYILFNFYYSIYAQMLFFALMIVWLSTFLIQVPLHNCISGIKNTKNIKELIYSNWIRTFFWIIKLILMILILIKNNEAQLL